MASVQVGNRKIRLPNFTEEEVKEAWPIFDKTILPIFENREPSFEEIKEIKLQGWMIAILRAKGLISN